MTDYNELRRLAEAATPGPWSAAQGIDWAGRVGDSEGMELADTREEQDAEFIAAANPEAVLELLDALDDSIPKTWQSLMVLLDEAYPDDLIPTREDDPSRDAGPRIASLIRQLDAMRARAKKAEREREEALRAIERVRGVIKPHISSAAWECDFTHAACDTKENPND